MESKIKYIRGIHPGIVLERELRQRKLAKGSFALSINEFPQTITSITKGKRRMNVPLAMKIEKALGMEEGFFMILQVYHDIAQENQKSKTRHPDLTILRPILFWDTTMDKIDWSKHKSAVIKRVAERGNAEEKNEIARFYRLKDIESFANEI